MPQLSGANPAWRNKIFRGEAESIVTKIPLEILLNYLLFASTKVKIFKNHRNPIASQAERSLLGFCLDVEAKSLPTLSALSSDCNIFTFIHVLLLFDLLLGICKTFLRSGMHTLSFPVCTNFFSTLSTQENLSNPRNKISSQLIQPKEICFAMWSAAYCRIKRPL